MKRVTFVIIASFLLVTLAFVQKGNIPAVKASPEVYQGDLILTGNNVTLIEGRFDINGSIIVEENATLILQNAILNFTQTQNDQFNITFRNPTNGNPRLVVENSTIAMNNYYMRANFEGNSTALISNLTITDDLLVYVRDTSAVSISDSYIYRIYPNEISDVNILDSVLYGANAQSYSNLHVSNCTLTYIMSKDDSNVYVSNCTITREVYVGMVSVNCSITEHFPSNVSLWNFELNCSVSATLGSRYPNFNLAETQVNGWTFEFAGSSNATISNSEVTEINAWGYSAVSVHNSSISRQVNSYDSSCCRIYNTPTEAILSMENSTLWLVNSTSNTYDIRDQTEVYVCWYLDVHVVDSIGQDVPSANVTATYPNATIAEQKQTDANGWVRSILTEKMMNATGEYPFGNYTVEATYETHSNSTTVNMTDNQMITLVLSDFIIPEFPSFLILPLFFIATLLAVIVHRRKHAQRE